MVVTKGRALQPQWAERAGPDDTSRPPASVQRTVQVRTQLGEEVVVAAQFESLSRFVPVGYGLGQPARGRALSTPFSN
jgi:hypothetical protein